MTVTMRNDSSNYNQRLINDLVRARNEAALHHESRTRKVKIDHSLAARTTRKLFSRKYCSRHLMHSHVYLHYFQPRRCHQQVQTSPSIILRTRDIDYAEL